jgi:DNA invertase Pin-like site-specific DNA recombinase
VHVSKRAAIYCRISQDRRDEGLGVARQEQDCRDLAARNGWEVGDVYVDNDVSAYSSKPRPAYRRLLGDLRAGTVEAVVAWHPDRLYRRLSDLVELMDIVKASQADIATVRAGDIDLSTPSGRMVAGHLGVAAQYESEHKAERQRRKQVELAENGRVSGGGNRPFGYEPGGRAIRESEAGEIRWAVETLLAGGSVRGIKLDWWRRGVLTPTGKAWSHSAVRRVLRSGRISGQREHHGVITATAEWPAIVTPEETAKVRAILDAPSRRDRRPARTYVLSGFVRCGNCGATMISRAVKRADGSHARRYACSKENRGCGGVGILAEPVEDLVVGATFRRLDTPALADMLDERSEEGGGRDLIADIADIEGRLEELAEMWAAKELTRAEWAAARSKLSSDLDAARTAYAAQVDREATERLLPAGGHLQVVWPGLSLDQRRAILREIVTSVTIALTSRANNKFDPSRIDISWRV